MSTTRHIADLIYRELEGNLSGPQALELEQWRAENPEHEDFHQRILDEDGLTGTIRVHHPLEQERVKAGMLKRIEGQLHFKVVPLYRRGFFRIAVAACIVALMLGGGYFLLFNKQGETPPVIADNGKDIAAPVSDKAMIEFEGQLIAVDTLTSYTNGNVTVTRTVDGRIIYTGFGSEVKFNTLTNPRGSKVIDISLADGSHVWLNAGSSVTYPIAFNGNERKVSMAGEAYFEVAQNTSMPFTVSKGDKQVQVLGTKFNVNAYDDEPDMKVTLLEGSVKVSDSRPGIQNSKFLTPGQQAKLADRITVVSNVSLDEVMAWKNGLFSFDRADLKKVMREISRWYDVEIEYQGNPAVMEFGGQMERNLNLSQVLKGLEKSKVHFKIEEKKIIVTR